MRTPSIKSQTPAEEPPRYTYTGGSPIYALVIAIPVSVLLWALIFAVLFILSQ